MIGRQARIRDRAKRVLRIRGEAHQLRRGVARTGRPASLPARTAAPWPGSGRAPDPNSWPGWLGKIAHRGQIRDEIAGTRIRKLRPSAWRTLPGGSSERPCGGAAPLPHVRRRQSHRFSRFRRSPAESRRRRSYRHRSAISRSLSSNWMAALRAAIRAIQAAPVMRPISMPMMTNHHQHFDQGEAGRAAADELKSHSSSPTAKEADSGANAYDLQVTSLVVPAVCRPAFVACPLKGFHSARASHGPCRTTSSRFVTASSCSIVK